MTDPAPPPMPQPLLRMEPLFDGPAVFLPVIGFTLALRLRAAEGATLPPGLRLRLRWLAPAAPPDAVLDAGPLTEGRAEAVLQLRLAAPDLPPGRQRLEFLAESADGVAIASLALDAELRRWGEPAGDMPSPFVLPRLSLAALPGMPAASPADTADRRLVQRGAVPAPAAPLHPADLARMREAGAMMKHVGTSAMLPPLSVAALHGAALLGHRLVVVSRQGVVEESIAAIRPLPDGPGLLDLLRAGRSPPLRRDAVALPLANRRNAAGMNHFHFHAEHLCALLQLEKLRAARPELEFETLLPAYDAVQAEAVALLAPDLGPRGPVGEAELEARLLLVPSLSFHSRSGPDPVVAEVFARLRARLGQPGAGASHVYVSRFDASKRRLDNETALAERLRERGFAIFEARGRSYREQALALAGARVIVGPHGAGLTNIGFAAPGALLVEILPAFLVPGYFRRLAGALGHLYRCFTQPAAASPGGDMPWTLDLDAFLRFLDPLLDES